MAVYLTTNLIGTFVFDAKGTLLEQKPAPVDCTVWSPAEKSIIEKYQEEKFYIGFKQQKLEGIKISQNPKMIAAISETLRKKVTLFFKPNLILTKQAVKASVNEDLFINHAISNIEELDRSANILVKRLREWYELYLPEYSRNTADNEAFAKTILEKDKQALFRELKLNEDESMGATLAKQELEPIFHLAKKVNELYSLRKDQEQYLEKTLKAYAPNLQTVAGTMIGAKLLSLAGSLKKLMLFPASTVQLLGAEKALFRHLRTGAKSPRHGIIVNHPLILHSPQKEHGKRARALADKITIAVRVDYFKGKFVGDQLITTLEKKFTWKAS